ncbi:MAG: hypothetical protein WCK62_07155 [Actinomycetes bacterium]
MTSNFLRVITLQGASKSVRIMALLAVGSLGVVGVTSATSANLNATAFNTANHQIDSGTLRLTLADVGPGAGFTTTVSQMAPGDTEYRYVTLTQGAKNVLGLTPKLQISDVNSTLLTTDKVRGLQITVQNCATAWTVSAGSTAASCTGGATSVIANTSIVNLKTLTTLNNYLLAKSNVNYLQFAINLPAGNDEATANGSLTPTISNGSQIITAGSISGSVASFTTASAAQLSVGEVFSIANAVGGTGYNTTYTVLTSSGTTVTATPAVNPTGSMTSGTATESTIQELTALITWTFSETQRVATSNNA